MDRAITVAVVANRAVENMIAENAVKRFSLGSNRVGRFRIDVDSGRNGGGACPDEFAVNFDHARITRLNGAKLRVVTNLGNLTVGAVDDSDEALISRCFL